MSALQSVFKQVKHWEYGAMAECHDRGEIDKLVAAAKRDAYRNVAMLIADKLHDYIDPPALEILNRVELLRKCNLSASEKHTDRLVRERCAGAADCCARLLASFAPQEESEECSTEQ